MEKIFWKKNRFHIWKCIAIWRDRRLAFPSIKNIRKIYACRKTCHCFMFKNRDLKCTVEKIFQFSSSNFTVLCNVGRWTPYCYVLFNISHMARCNSSADFTLWRTASLPLERSTRFRKWNQLYPSLGHSGDRVDPRRLIPYSFLVFSTMI